MGIHLHAEEGNNAALIADLDSGIAVDVRDEQGRTPLMVAAASPKADALTLQLLLDHSADPNALTLPNEPVKPDGTARKTPDSVLGFALQKKPRQTNFTCSSRRARMLAL